MITDRFLTVSGSNTPGSSITGQAITADAVSTDVIDLGTARDIGEGRDLFMVFTVIQAFNNLTSLSLQVVTDDNEAIPSPTVIGSVTALLAGSGLAAGKQYIVPIPPQVASLGERYLAAYYDVTGTAPTQGSILAQIVTDIQDGRKFYGSRIVVA